MRIPGAVVFLFFLRMIWKERSEEKTIGRFAISLCNYDLTSSTWVSNVAFVEWNLSEISGLPTPNVLAVDQQTALEPTAVNAQ